MKSKQSKAKPQNKTASDAQAPAGRVKEQGLALTNRADGEERTAGPRPTELELAQLAAQLARTLQIDPKQLVREAWSLYQESCQRIRAADRESQQRQESAEAVAGVDEIGEALPRPQRYPVTFQDVERLLLPKLKGRTAERAALVREYIFFQMINQSFVLRGGFRFVSYWEFQAQELEPLRAKLADDVAQRFGEWRAHTFDAEAYAKFATDFLKWHHRWTDLRNSQVKAANAVKGWEKRRQSGTTQTGAKPKLGALKEVLDPPRPGS